jgi:hypothetical protein
MSNGTIPNTADRAKIPDTEITFKLSPTGKPFND